MKLKALLLLILAALLPLAAPQTAQARSDVSFDYFYDALLPHGEWIEVDGYGYCWRPTEMDADWVPYSDGYWAFTDAGWTWVGYEEFAGIVYHYGRWVSVETAGWCWVPDYEWGPGWVSWRNSEEHIGWAPLPPRVAWQPEVGISTWVDSVYNIGPASYSFCRVRDFGTPVLRPVIVDRSRNVTIIRTTVNITNITYNTYGDVPVIYNGGPSYVSISRRSERPIPALKLVRQTKFDRSDFRRGPGGFSPNARTLGNQLLVNAPIVAPPVQPTFLKEKVKRVFAADKVRDGWAGVKDPQERAELRQRFQRETKGLTPQTAPARAVAVSDLKVVPEQADPTAVSPVSTGKGPRGKGQRQPPAVAEVPVVPTTPVAPVAEVATPGKEGRGPRKPGDVSPGDAPPNEPRTATKMERPRDGDTTVPPAVAGNAEKPPVPGTENDQARKGRGLTANPPVVVPKGVEDVTPVPPPVITAVPDDSREGRAQKPMKNEPGEKVRAPGEGKPALVGEGKPAQPVVNPPAAAPTAAQTQVPAVAGKGSRDQANVQEQRMNDEKQRAAQTAATAAEQAKGGQERLARERQAAADATMTKQKQAEEAAGVAATKEKMQQKQQRTATADGEKAQADQEERMARQRQADASAAAQQKQLESQRQAEGAKQAESKSQQMEAQREGQVAEQRRQAQAEQQRAAQDAAKQQAKTQQMEQQRAAQDAAKQQAAAQQAEQQRAAQDAAKQQAKTQQMEQQRAAQDAAKQQAAAQQAEQQRAAQDAAKQQAKTQQMEQQRAAQDAAKQQAAAQQVEQQRAAHDAAKQQAKAQQMEQQRAAQDAARQQAAAQARAQQMEQQRAAQDAARQQAAAQARAQQVEQQRAAQDAARQQARAQQMEQQRAAQDASRQQAAAQAKAQQMEQQRAGQEAARQQAEQQRRAADAQRVNAARQQAEAQRAAQQQAAQAAQPPAGQPGGGAPDDERGKGKKKKD